MIVGFMNIPEVNVYVAVTSDRVELIYGAAL